MADLRLRPTLEEEVSQTVVKLFATRAEAKCAPELLVQQHGIDRSNIFIAAHGPDNSVWKVVNYG